MTLRHIAASAIKGTLQSCTGWIIFVLIWIAVSLLVGMIFNWFFLVPLIPLFIVGLALYLNFSTDRP